MPLAESVVDGARRPDATGKGFPLTAGAQDVEDGVSGPAVVHSGAAAAGLWFWEGETVEWKIESITSLKMTRKSVSIKKKKR